MRTKITPLTQALVGRFGQHHAFLCRMHLDRLDALDVDIADLDTQIEAQIAPFAGAVTRLDEIPGVGATTAAVIIAEVGDDMTRFPTPAHLSSWARFAPGVKESAGRKKGTGATGHGDRYLARVLGEAAVSAAKTDTFLGERYRRIARRRGKKKAIVAVGRSILSSSGTYYPIPKPVTTTWVLVTTTHASTQNVGSATTSASWRLSATRSPCNPLPEPPEYSTSPLQPIPAALRSAGMLRLPAHHPFSS